LHPLFFPPPLQSASLSAVHPSESAEPVPPELVQRQERERLALQAQTRAMEQRHAQEWAAFQKRRADGTIADPQELRNLEELESFKTVVEANNDSFEKALAALEGMTLDERPKSDKRKRSNSKPPSPSNGSVLHPPADAPAAHGSGPQENHSSVGQYATGNAPTPLAGVGGVPKESV